MEVNVNEAVNIISENALPYLEEYINRYNKSRKTALVLRWLTLTEYPGNTVVQYLQRSRSGVEIAQEMSLAGFIVALMYDRSSIRLFARIAIKRAGGEENVKAILKDQVSSKVANFLGQEEHPFFLYFSTRAGVLNISLHNARTNEKIRDFSQKELSDVIKESIQEPETGEKLFLPEIGEEE